MREGGGSADTRDVLAEEVAEDTAAVVTKSVQPGGEGTYIMKVSVRWLYRKPSSKPKHIVEVQLKVHDTYFGNSIQAH